MTRVWFDKKIIDKQHRGEYRVDVVSANLMYEGWAQPGTATSTPGWHIQRTVVIGTETIVSEPVGKFFSMVWDDRATYFDTPPWDINKSLRFNGIAATVNLGNNLDKTWAQNFSYSFWIRPRVVNTQQTWISKRSTSTFYGWEFKMLANGRPDINFTGTTGSLRVQYAVSLAPLTWYHVVVNKIGDVTPEPANIQLFINGVQVALTTITNTLAGDFTNPADLIFGGYSTNNYFDGYMCDVRLFNAILTAAEVTEIYNGAKPKDPATFSNPSIHTNGWRLGTNDLFNIATDEIGGVNGTMTNMLSTDIQSVYP